MKTIRPSLCRNALLAQLVFLLIPVEASDLLDVAIRLGDVSINKVPFVLAYEEGLYRKNGLNVDQFISPGAARFVEDSGVRVPRRYIRNDTAPVSAGGGTPLMVSRTTRVDSMDRIILATTDRVVRWHIIASQGIHNLDQLKGKRLGYSGYGAMTHMIWLALSEKQGWDPLKDVSLMGQGAGVGQLQKGAVDAFIAGEVPYAMARRAGYSPMMDLPIAGSGVQTTRSWLSENRETARRLIRSLVEAIALMKRDKKAAFKAMETWYGVTDPQLQWESCSTPAFRSPSSKSRDDSPSVRAAISLGPVPRTLIIRWSGAGLRWPPLAQRRGPCLQRWGWT